MLKQLTLACAPIGNNGSIQPFDSTFDFKVNAARFGFEQADAFVLWGGEDIHPSLYNAKANKFNGARGGGPSDRDLWEWQAIKYCKANRIPIIGVCRGAQMLCAAAGGKLIQHVKGHVGGGSGHLVQTNEGEVFHVTSCHHQMMDVYNTNHEMLAWTPSALSDCYFGEECETPKHISDMIAAGAWAEPEMVYFPELNALAIQGHPEWAIGSAFDKWCNKTIAELLLVNEGAWK